MIRCFSVLEKAIGTPLEETAQKVLKRQAKVDRAEELLNEAIEEYENGRWQLLNNALVHKGLSYCAKDRHLVRGKVTIFYVHGEGHHSCHECSGHYEYWRIVSACKKCSDDLHLYELQVLRAESRPDGYYYKRGDSWEKYKGSDIQVEPSRIQDGWAELYGIPPSIIGGY